MTKQFTENEMETLETMMDRASLTDILWALEQIALEKADHVRSNWQDERMANFWEKDAAVVAKAAERVRN